MLNAVSSEESCRLTVVLFIDVTTVTEYNFSRLRILIGQFKFQTHKLYAWNSLRAGSPLSHARVARERSEPARWRSIIRIRARARTYGKRTRKGYRMVFVSISEQASSAFILASTSSDQICLASIEHFRKYISRAANTS